MYTAEGLKIYGLFLTQAQPVSVMQTGSQTKMGEIVVYYTGKWEEINNGNILNI